MESYSVTSIEAMDELLLRGSSRVVAKSGSTETVRVKGDGAAHYVKTYRYDTWGARLRCALRGTLVGRTRARREWEALRFLREAGLGAPRAMLAESRRWGFVTRAVIATEEVAGAESLDAIVAREGRLEGGESGELARELGAWVARMHAARYADGNLHFRNILVSVGKRGGFSKIDSPRGRVFRSEILFKKARRRDLAVLTLEARGYVSDRHCLRFLKEYCRLPWSGGRRALALECMAGADRMARRRPRRDPGEGIVDI